MRLVILIVVFFAGFFATGAAPQSPGVPADCSVDVTSGLLAWIAAAPDGATLTFEPNGCYRIDGTLEISGRNNLTFEGNGATFRAFTQGGSHRAHWRFVGGSGNTLRNMTIVGSNPNGGVWDGGALQWQHGLDLSGVQGFTAENVTISDTYADAVALRMLEGGSAWSQDVTLTNVSASRLGRAGIFIGAGRRVNVSGGYIEKAGLNAFDIEPNGIGDGAEQITVDGVTFGPVLKDEWAFTVLSMGTNVSVSGITLRNNQFVGQPFSVWADLSGSARIQNLSLLNNVGAVVMRPLPAQAIYVVRTHGLTVTGNTQPLNAGQALVATCRVTAVNVSGNSYPGGAVEHRRLSKGSC